VEVPRIAVRTNDNQLDSAAKELLDRLLSDHPEWSDYFEQGQPASIDIRLIYPRLCIPSGHPTITTPLTIELGGEFAFNWYCGCFWDLSPANSDTLRARAADFLDRFFAEEIRCGVCWHNGEPVGGGPVEGDGVPDWIGTYDLIEVKSWRGNRDESKTF
jgi:hypothetical protein